MADTLIPSNNNHTVDPAVAGLIEGDQTYETVSERLASIVLRQDRHGLPWWLLILIGFGGVNVLGMVVVKLLFTGVGIFGNNMPVSWGWPIINFVWWIGIGHAGTLISAFLLLMRQGWRASINRLAEAMTIFAVSCAGIFPALHTGRPWVDYWLFPYPNILAMWPQWRSPLLWDVFAVTVYALVSILFWFVGLIPDLATLRDRAENQYAKLVYGIACLGWRGSAEHWQRYENASIMLAGLATPLVVSVESIIALDFTIGIVPGWHATIFPPYFFAGALYAGFSMVIMLAIPLRKWYHLEDYITPKHIDWCAKLMLVTGLVVLYGYIMECCYAYLSGDRYEISMMHYRQFGPYWAAYWLLILFSCVLPQMLWIPKIRHNNAALYFLAIMVSIGMWLEKFIVVVVSLTHDYLPSSWGYFTNTFWDVAMYAGTIGQFILLFFLFVRFLPVINISEVREIVLRTSRPFRRNHASSTNSDSVTEPAGITSEPVE